jgi:sugar lactone lactonase YvrE
MTFAAIGYGAYQVTAKAYPAADCSQVPERAPWGTIRPTAAIVSNNSAPTIALSLYKVGDVGVGTSFVDTPQVIAQGQARIATITAVGNVVAWVMRPGNPTIGSVGRFVDNDLPTDQPVTIASGLQRPNDLGIDPATGDVYWFGYPSVQNPDGSWPADGRIQRWRAATASVSTISTGMVSGGEIAVDPVRGQVYWNEIGASAVHVYDIASGAQNLYATGQAGSNSLALDNGTVYWSNWDDRSIRRKTPGGAVQDVVPANPAEVPVNGMAVDEAYVYWVDWNEAAGGSAIKRAPKNGGPTQQLWPQGTEGPIAGGAWPIEVYKDYLYVSGGGGIWRMPKDGSAPLELVQDGATLGLAIGEHGGHGYLYWSDREFGGVVWRVQIPE